MDKLEELLSNFEIEINDVSGKEIVEVEKDIEDICTRTLKELEDNAKQATDFFYEQEISEMNADHAIAISHLNDEFNRLLMGERDALVQGVFEVAKEHVIAFANSAEYTDKLQSKLTNLKGNGLTPAKLFVRPADEKILKSLLKTYELECDGELDPSILYGGFRLECPTKGIIVDETYDAALADAKQWFLQNSGLTIR